MVIIEHKFFNLYVKEYKEVGKMQRKLFCQISPLTYSISIKRQRLERRIKDLLSNTKFSTEKSEKLPVVVYKHNSLIRRKLGNVNMELQENKAVNLSLAAPKINGIIIRPGETFSFWKLVGICSAKKGYKEGLTISLSQPTQGIGGGMCQFTNLIHWLSLHSPLDIIEHHHHNNIDMFPDFGRQVPFGCGTSILFNYLDYRLKNNTDNTFQLIVHTSETHLCGELRAFYPLNHSYHVVEKDMYFEKIDDNYYRKNKIYRETIDKRTGNMIKSELIKESNAKVLYSEEFINKDLLKSVEF